LKNLGGKKFYLEQLQFLKENKTDELIDAHYHDDAVLVSFTATVRGKKALKLHFRAYMQNLSPLVVKSTEKFTSTEDSIFLEATVESAMGQASVCDAFVLRDGNITHHFTGVT
jgi:hypothetical protein